MAITFLLGCAIGDQSGLQIVQFFLLGIQTYKIVVKPLEAQFQFGRPGRGGNLLLPGGEKATINRFNIMALESGYLLGGFFCDAILIVLLQPGNSEGLGALQGSTGTFFGKNKAKNMEGKLRKLPVGIAIAIVVLCIVFGALELFFI